MRFKRMMVLVLAIGVLMPLAATHTLSAAEKSVTATVPIVDLNKAGIGELTTVPGIGDVMAQRIVDWRKENGPFKRLEDLMKVKGVGEKKLAQLRPYLKIGRSS